MILRRVMEHLRKQEWTAIGIDFVIVVVGVFVGIQVSNWNSDAVDRRRGVEYVERLSRDLEADLAARRADVAYYAAVQDGLVRANALLNQPSSDAEDLVVAAYRGSELIYSAPTRATWDEIVSAGDIGLLPRGAVESGIASYFAADTGQMSAESMERSEYRRAVRETIPLEIQIALRSGCSDVRDDHGRIVGFVEHCTLDVDRAAMERAAAAIRASEAIRRTLRYQYSNVYSARSNLNADVIELERGLAALRGE